MSAYNKDSAIAAPATPVGRGGVAIVRVSGSDLKELSIKLTKKNIKPRFATHCNFYDIHEEVIDKGVFILFPGPNSYTGEDVLELHCHGSPVIVAAIMDTLCMHGVKVAEPGEFTKRAFLNGKMSLCQAEAVADVISANSMQASKLAMRSLSGDFLARVSEIVNLITSLRVYVEASLDFVEEELDLLHVEEILKRLDNVCELLTVLLSQAEYGERMRNSEKIVLVGDTNVGKSSIFNKLSRQKSAIVTNVAGTTRDIINKEIVLDKHGTVIDLFDTAGIRNTEDVVEKEGIARSKEQLSTSDIIVIVFDATKYVSGDYARFISQLGSGPKLPVKIITVFNKIDLVPYFKAPEVDKLSNVVNISAKSGSGMTQLATAIKDMLQRSDNSNEQNFMARKRHVISLQKAKETAASAQKEFIELRAAELLAENLRVVQDYLGEITGEVSSDDLLGEIFSSFCVGK